MRHLVSILVGLILAAGVGYFVGFDHGFKGSQQQAHSIEWSTVSTAALVMSKIIGTWQSANDPSFIREIRNDGSVVDRYADTEDTTGWWMVFTKEVPDPAFPYTYEDGVTYFSIVSTEGDTLYYKIMNVGDVLELVYLDRGGTLSFTRIP